MKPGPFFRDFGFGKRSMESLIEDEFLHLAQKLEATGGQPIETMDLFNVPVLNALMRILLGQRFDGNDPKMSKTMLQIENLIADSGKTFAILGFNSVRILKFFEFLGLLRVVDGMNAIFELVDEQIADHEATLQPDSLRDFFDCFIDKRILQNDLDESRKFAKHNLRNIAFDLFLAGSETTSSSLKWAVLYMILNQDVQTRVQVNVFLQSCKVMLLFLYLNEQTFKLTEEGH